MVYSKFYMASFLFLEMSQQLHSVTINARDIGSKKKCTGKFGDYLACWLFFNLDNREEMLLNVRETVLS